LVAIPKLDFVGNRDNFAIAEHNLRRTLEAVFDIARHISVKMAWGHPQSYRETIELITANGVLNGIHMG
jgi:uncharacterized protein YutE (UPF0331/DUF86 family)